MTSYTRVYSAGSTYSIIWNICHYFHTSTPTDWSRVSTLWYYLWV
jgi:hypothetical protein